jgi:hypothetical protein
MSVARVDLDLAVSILQVHGVNSATQGAPQPTPGPQRAALSFCFTLPAILETFFPHVPCE